ncbi:hypothetical protein HYC85_023088 [Camellia sinensis]|uniref:Protein kinase domain-containing protein n=1 Tax=Camellia sinensis TaxID=4442 RepID=A0A7J7GDJ6_CAMSI|nr:hypothetical protein HYC85_023088 [Camellia sinensis]
MATKEGVSTNPIFFHIFTLFFMRIMCKSSVATELLKQVWKKRTKDKKEKKRKKRVWVANPNNPLNDSGVLTIDSSTRILKFTSRGRTVLNISDQVAANNVTATLQDSGNFVLTDHENGDRILWESFDHPTDTLLPGMKLGFSIATGQKKNWSLTSWLSDYFPTSGAFTMNWEPSKESGQLVIYRRGERYWTSGLMRNQTQTFESIPTLSGPPIRYRYILNYISNNDEKYFTFSVEEKRREKEFLQELISSDNFNNANDGEDDGTEGHALKILSFASVVEATNNFSIENKLGQSGFGPVYKGILQEGRVIAVKRLSTTSCQGLVEFKNELILISKLQHTNLVRVLGCCIHGEEKMLIYEYLLNNSLDTYIFDPAKRGLLDWTKRLNIIEGVAQGLLYLHKYSRMRVIHRDLKASNVLLDENMNAKISDFGMARIFKINETEANTKKPAGT